MGWNYRVVRNYRDPDGEPWCEIWGEWLTIHEVYYRGDRIWIWSSATDANASGGNMKDLKSNIRMYAAATKLPILECRRDRNGRHRLYEPKAK